MSPRAAAPIGAFRYHHPIEVRFVDTDALGHVNNATYLTYFEAARAGYYQAMMGTPFGTGEMADRHTFRIAEARVRYRVPAFFGEPLVCDCRVAWVGRSSFGLDYLVRSEGSPLWPARLVADGDTVQVMYDLQRERVTRIPSDLVERFESFEGQALPRRVASNGS
ncbi:MAG TPA: thioesterase family protein [Myxococcaceae bacterium]